MASDARPRPAPELFLKVRPNGADLRKAPLRGSLCAFEHPREPGDQELAWLAGRQHWCLHRRQLHAGGVGRRGVAARIKRRQLTALSSDVFLVGRGDGDPLTSAMGVVLHFRGHAVISREYATWMWGLTDPVPKQVIATVAGHGFTPMPGVSLHRVTAIDPADLRWRKGLPLTAPARSLLDFAATKPSLARVESTLAMFRRQHLDADRQLRAALDRLPNNHGGAPLIRRLLTLKPGELVLTRSIYERALRELITGAGLPAPVSNLMVAGHERDLAWPEARLIVEFDGWIFHRDRFREDRARDARAVAAGWRVIRLTADRVDTEPHVVLAEIAAALAAWVRH